VDLNKEKRLRALQVSSEKVRALMYYLFRGF
jgi:hypothetical protein